MEQNPLSEVAYQNIKERIINGTYQPGETLSEGDIADSLEMSRQPVRIAVHRLYEDGWLTGSSRRKIKVKEITEKDLEEIYAVKKLLELPALKMIFEKEKTWEFSFALEEIILKMRANINSRILFERFDLDFHSCLIRIYENSRMEKFFNSNREEILRINLLSQEEEYDISYHVNELMEIVLAIRENRYEDARKIYEKHIDDGLEKNREIFKKKIEN